MPGDALKIARLEWHQRPQQLDYARCNSQALPWREDAFNLRLESCFHVLTTGKVLRLKAALRQNTRMGRSSNLRHNFARLAYCLTLE